MLNWHTNLNKKLQHTTLNESIPSQFKVKPNQMSQHMVVTYNTLKYLMSLLSKLHWDMEYGAYLFILHFWSLADVVEMLSLRFQLLCSKERKWNKIQRGKIPFKKIIISQSEKKKNYLYGIVKGHNFFF